MPDGNAFKPYYHTTLLEKMAHFLKPGEFQFEKNYSLQWTVNFSHDVKT